MENDSAIKRLLQHAYELRCAEIRFKLSMLEHQRAGIETETVWLNGELHSLNERIAVLGREDKT